MVRKIDFFKLNYNLIRELGTLLLNKRLYFVFNF